MTTRKLNPKILKSVKEILIEHKGKNKAIPSNEIAEIVGIEPGASNVIIRAYITGVINRFSLPIASAGRSGYYLIEKESELKAYKKSIQGRMKKIQDRLINVIANYLKYYGEEELELTSEMIIPEEDIIDDEHLFEEEETEEDD